MIPYDFHIFESLNLQQGKIALLVNMVLKSTWGQTIDPTATKGSNVSLKLCQQIHSGLENGEIKEKVEKHFCNDEMWLWCRITLVVNCRILHTGKSCKTQYIQKPAILSKETHFTLQNKSIFICRFSPMRPYYPVEFRIFKQVVWWDFQYVF